MKNTESIQQTIESYITDQNFIEGHRRSPKFFTRNTQLSFATIMALMLTRISKSLAIEMNFLGNLMKEKPVTKQAFSIARSKIAASGFIELYQKVLEMHYTDNPLRLWKGYRVIGVDSSTLPLAKRGDLPDVFGDHFDRTCLGRTLQFVELTSDVPIAAQLAPYNKSEEAMAREMLPTVVEQMRSYGISKPIYVYDRGFPSHKFSKHHIDLGVNFLFRAQKAYSKEIRELVKLGKEASYIQTVDKQGLKYQYRVVIRYLSSKHPLILITNLLNSSELSDDDLVNLYELRWRCEEAFKFQKTVLQMDGCWSRTSEGVYQEYWAIILLFTLMTLKFNELEDQEHDQDEKPTSRINRRVVFGSLKLRYLQVLLGKIDAGVFEKEFREQCRIHRVPIRPGRSFSRPSVDTRKTRHCYRRVI